MTEPNVMAEPRLTKAQAEAVRVLAMEGPARESSVTRPRGLREPCIYWPSWTALKRLGYAGLQPGACGHAEITEAGRMRAGLLPGSAR